MEDSYSPDLITLIDDENEEHNFEIIDTVEYEDSEYYALYPILDDPSAALEDSGEYYIMEAFEQDGEWQLAEVEDDDLIYKLSEIFENRFADSFDEDEDE